MSREISVHPEATGMQTLDWQERLNVLDKSYGFLPTTKQELNVAFSAIPFLTVAGSVGRHLNEILIHQNTHQVEQPERAVRAVVRDMGIYRGDAKKRRAGLLAIHEQLKDVNPELSVGQVDDFDLTGLLSVIQYAHIKHGQESGSDHPIKGGIKTPPGGKSKRLMTHYDPEAHDRITTEIIAGKIIDEKILSLKGLVLQAGSSQRKRLDFWGHMLSESRSHLAARPIVDELLSLE